MRRKTGIYLQAAGVYGLLAAAGAGDTGAITAPELAAALIVCLSLFAVGFFLCHGRLSSCFSDGSATRTDSRTQ